jgi:hypothetical protein
MAGKAYSIPCSEEKTALGKNVVERIGMKRLFP